MAFQNNFEEYLNSKSQAEPDKMTQKEQQDLEEAIKKSRESASIEKQRRDFDLHPIETRSFYKSDDDAVKEKPVAAKQGAKQRKSPVEILKLEKDSSQSEFKFTFQDLPEPSGKQLDIIYHDPVFDLPVTLDPQYKKYSITQRAKALFGYYQRVDKIRSRLARASLLRAPWPKPILPSNKCKYSLLKGEAEEDTENGSLDEFVEQMPVQDLYVSRSGRQIKRKIYTEDQGDSDVDFAYSNKKNKTDDSDTKITLDNPYVPEENHSEAKIPLRNFKPKVDSPRRPLPLSLRKPTNRAEAIFDKLVQDGQKKKQQEEEMYNFQKTLPSFSEIDEEKWLAEESPVKEIREDEDADFAPRRIVPPIPLKKVGRPKKTSKQEDPDKITSMSESPPGSPVLKRYSHLNKSTESKSKQKLRSQKSRENLQSEEIVISKLEKTACPICNRKFLQSEILNHASTCGEIFEEDAEPNRSAVKTITCELCDKQFAVNTDYEVHVQQCIAAKVTDL